MAKCRIKILRAVIDNSNLPILPTGEPYLRVTPDLVWADVGPGKEGTFNVESNTLWNLE